MSNTSQLWSQILILFYLISFANVHISQMPNLTQAVLFKEKMGNPFNFNLYLREKMLFIFSKNKKYHGIVNHVHVQCSPIMAMCGQSRTPNSNYVQQSSGIWLSLGW